eukprot:CAMPEP_0206423002 /NCGR_PEP_ID=MMETSP0324_2-20121206/2429_1 /ASSEMBLY_ACC=CAM_ASM_000836 /TAXON_ID=2866 /ORGANISM="Crypthecodinium cohnii, Strain Seligo" /LENGTH=48 /DNA_ID=CAMNT_0053887495 /DNA_START=183 /DNA_END=332 /DNA_ORIENTATION=+
MSLRSHKLWDAKQRSRGGGMVHRGIWAWSVKQGWRDGKQGASGRASLG